jgi:hypothetical protein
LQGAAPFLVAPFTNRTTFEWPLGAPRVVSVHAAVAAHGGGPGPDCLGAVWLRGAGPVGPGQGRERARRRAYGLKGASGVRVERRRGRVAAAGGAIGGEGGVFRHTRRERRLECGQLHV